MTKPNPLAAGLYLLLNLASGIFWFVLLVTLVAVGLGLAPLGIGLVLLYGTVELTRGAAKLERAWVRSALKVDIATPPLPAETTGLRGARQKALDPAVWRSFLYFVLLLPVGALEFSAVVAIWSVIATLVGVPFWIEYSMFDIVISGWVIDSFVTALPLAALGLLLVPLGIYATRALGMAHGRFAHALLGPSRAELLSVEAERLQSSRARGVEAAEAERRRIERDLHDGAQQRLVAVAMGLGRAKSKMGSDPETAKKLLEEAHADAKLAIKELRDLARGIYPSVLGDRGLDPALSALAARCPIEVELQVDVEPRPPTSVESAAYFTVAEALTNITKHSNGTRATVKVNRTETGVLVEVTDNGQGGATLRPGGGLAGLADRAATIDGVVVVVSPEGGPTVIRAELPCAW
ncbi:sensor histidine kinase [Lentzea sp. NBRC 105346]|uniref:sensor histidine kinase n=1 Tax=Lentzea sp. NBRC 105346 TaxID=3032205 RepID=UPI002556C420|nr:sensor histidine kinase [Lentzea sp. NBRC 105346]